MSESPFRPDNPIFRFFRIGNSIGQLVSRACDGSGLSSDEYGVFSGVVALGPVSPSVLAAKLAVPPTTISVYLARFLEKGIVRRLPNPQDGRSYLVEATDRGRELVAYVAPRLRVEAEALMAASEVSYDDLMTALGALEDAARAALDGDTTNV